LVNSIEPAIVYVVFWDESNVVCVDIMFRTLAPFTRNFMRNTPLLLVSPSRCS
jgi:hypothetical protein